MFQMLLRSVFVLICCLTAETWSAGNFALCSTACAAENQADAAPPEPVDERTADVAAFQQLTRYCLPCHNAEQHKGNLDLSRFSSRASMLRERTLWKDVLRVLKDEEMPPQAPLPSMEERQQLVEWVDRSINDLDWSRLQQAGHVTFPRLTKDEYNNTMRDLLGMDLRPGDRLSEDGQGESGFANDRDALFLSPAQLEKYLTAARQAISAVLALRQPPQVQHFESESMLMTETRETPKPYRDDFLGYVLNRGQMTLYESVTFPHDGFYRFTLRARSTAGPTAALLRINDREAASIEVPAMEPDEYSAMCFVPAGTHQMTWNVEKPEQPRRATPPMPAPVLTFRSLDADAGTVVSRQSALNAPVWPANEADTQQAKRQIDRLNAAGIAVQRPLEWLRLLGNDGDPREMQRFSSYVTERTATVESALDELAAALSVSRDQAEHRYREHNAQRLADNTRLMQQARKAIADWQEKTPPPPPAKPGDVAIDWIRITGPLSPGSHNPAAELLIAEPSAELTAEQAGAQVLRHFATRAFRRPLLPDELAGYQKLFSAALDRGESYEHALGLALSAVLVSPNFLYRVEQQTAFGSPHHEAGSAQPDPTDSAALPHAAELPDLPLNDYELASRLSYFLWLSMPDARLFELAESHQLHNDDVLRAEVGRMLSDQKAQAFAEAFTGQWLGFASLGTSVLPDAQVFPEFTSRLAEDMQQETVLMFSHLMQNGGQLHELVHAEQTFLNARLARHYGIPGVQGDHMRLVKLNSPVRGGLLGMGSILTTTSSPSRTSPVVRGKWVLETLLGEPAGDPPPDAGVLPGNAGQSRGTTLREELEIHRRNPACATCHDRIDPLGFGLENFDATGRFRDTENGQPIDSTGHLPDGSSFAGPAELKKWLLQNRREQLTRNLSERLLSFALGRKLQFYDEAAIREITEAARQNDYRIDAMIEAVVLSYPFRHQGTAEESFSAALQ